MFAGTLFLIPAAIALPRVLRERQMAHLVFIVFVALAVLNYELLPRDWMREFRFATPFIVFSAAAVVVLARADFANVSYVLGGTRFRRAVCGSVAVAGLAFFAYRSFEFAQLPTTPFDVTTDRYAFSFNNYARDMALTDASILSPDIGGTLYYSDLRVQDLAGLIDRTIAKTLTKKEQLHEYIFEEMRPTFIVVHGTWIREAALDADTRLERDYATICEKTGRGGVKIYVRKNAVEGPKDEAVVDAASKTCEDYVNRADYGPWARLRI